MPPAAADSGLTIVRTGRDFHCAFQAMATPCEARIETDDRSQAGAVGAVVLQEARRIEQKFSRYRTDNIVFDINNAAGQWVTVDDETDLLLAFADQVHALSDGLFDITSGVLRRAWRFDGSNQIPTQAQLDELLPRVGWHRIERGPGSIRLPTGMEIDLGGLAKEYAVDRTLGMAGQVCPEPVLINFGGDLAVSGPRRDGSAWNVAIEAVDHAGMAAMLAIKHGAVATSGDARRFIESNGVRYGHIIDPRSGWPVANPLRSASVAGATCLEAGMIATLAILQGANGAAFLREQAAASWIIP